MPLLSASITVRCSPVFWQLDFFWLWLLLMAELRFYCFGIDLFSFFLVLVSYYVLTKTLKLRGMPARQYAG